MILFALRNLLAPLFKSLRKFIPNYLQLLASGIFCVLICGISTRSLVNLIALIYRDLFSSHFLPPTPTKSPDPSATFYVVFICDFPV